jgi:hypothetical protein
MPIILMGISTVQENLAGLFSGADLKGGKSSDHTRCTFFRSTIKFELDGRYYRKFGLYRPWATAQLLVVGIPYGNSVQLPFTNNFLLAVIHSLRDSEVNCRPGTYSL